MDAKICNYEFYMSEWIGERPNEKITDIERGNFQHPNSSIRDWSCPHESHPDSDYCIFHMRRETRQKRGITDTDIAKKVEECVNSEDEEPVFLGAKFGDLNLDHTYLSPPDESTIEFSFAHFFGILVSEKQQLTIARSLGRRSMMTSLSTLQSFLIALSFLVQSFMKKHSSPPSSMDMLILTRPFFMTERISVQNFLSQLRSEKLFSTGISNFMPVRVMRSL